MHYPNDFINKIICGDCLEILKEIPDESIDMVMTSPPYYALRNYQVEGQIGLEETFEEYLKKILDITAEIKRVLKKSGQFWLNLGDCYGSHTFGNSKSAGGIQKKLCQEKKGFPRYSNKSQSLGDKCLGMIPERLAIKMIDNQGWILRNKIKWAKQILNYKEQRTQGGVMPTCLSPETEVYIKDEIGIISPYKLKELLNRNTENLRILSPTGWKKIKNVWQVEHNKIIKFKVGSSTEIECSLQHKFPISHDNRRKRYEIKEAQKLRMGKNKMLDRFLFVPLEKFLPDDKEIELNYKWGKFIGLYVAEGGFVDYSKFKSYQGKFTLAKNEDNLANDIKWGLEKFEIKYKENFIRNYRSIVFNSRDVKNFVSRFVLGKCKEKRLNMVNILNTNREFRQGIFDGIIAGDGHIDKNKRITFGSASKQLRDDLYLLASSIGLLASKNENHRKDKRTNKIYDAYYLTIPLSLQKEKLTGERECQKGKPLTAKYTNEFKVKTLKFSNPQIKNETKWLIDIEVEDGLFLINGGVVSHNSVKDRFNESGEDLYFFVKNKRYYSNLDAVRLPNQVIGVTDMRASGFIRTRKLYPESKYNKFDYRAQNTKRKSLEERLENTKNKDQKSSRTYNVKKSLSEVRLGMKPNTGIMPNKVNDPRGNHEGGPGSWRDFKDKHPYRNKTSLDPNIRGLRQAPEPNEPNAFNIKGKNLPTIWLIQTEPHNFQKELGNEITEDHFATYPEALCNIPIRFGCPEKGIVLDPFAGSGTTCIVAKKLGRNYIGIELNPNYCKIAEKRLKATPTPLL